MAMRRNGHKGMVRPGAVRAFLLGVCLLLGAPVLAASGQETLAAHTARVLLREGARPARPVGGVTGAGGSLRLDVDLGDSGVFHVLLRPNRDNLYVVSDKLAAWVGVPLRPGARSLDELAADVVASAMPFGVPVLTLRVERGESLGRAEWQGYTAERTRVRFVAEFMGKGTTLDTVVWENAAFAPLPLRVEEMRRARDGSVRPGDAVELDDIKPASLSESEREALFEPPSGFTRYGSILDLLLYALAGT